MKHNIRSNQNWYISNISITNRLRNEQIYKDDAALPFLSCHMCDTFFSKFERINHIVFRVLLLNLDQQFDTETCMCLMRET